MTGGDKMYENLYAYSEEVEGKKVWLMFKPNFREALTLFDGKSKMLSDGVIRKEGELVLNGMHSEFQDVYVSENAQWFLEDKGHSFYLFVTEWTREINTSLGDEWNREFNRILKKCKRCYYLQKKEEIRLYFYCAETDRLRLCYKDEGYYIDDRYKYPLRRLFPTNPYCAIDKQYARPKESCFILGRVKRTIGLKNSKLLDFIEPVHKIELDFKKEEWDFGGYDYKRDKEELENQLFDLLSFCVLKEENPLEVMRVRAYLENYEGEQKAVVLQFKSKIREAFKKESVVELRRLNDVLKKKQDCTNVKF